MNVPHPDQYITFKDIFKAIWKLKIGITLGLLIGLVVSISYLRSVTPHYEASLVVGPVQQEDRNIQDLVVQTQKTAFLKDLLRQAVPAQAPQFEAFEHSLTAAHIAQKLSQNQALVTSVFWQSYDKNTQKWNPNSSLIRRIESLFIPSKKRNAPNAADIKRQLQKSIIISPVGLTDFKKITYRHPDPNFAQEFLQTLFHESDQFLREKAQQETHTRIRYLQDKIQQIRHSEHRDVLISLLKEQERAKLMSSLDLPFAARIIEQPFASARPVSPHVWLCILIGLFGGGLLGGFVSHMIRKT